MAGVCSVFSSWPVAAPDSTQQDSKPSKPAGHTLQHASSDGLHLPWLRLQTPGCCMPKAATTMQVVGWLCRAAAMMGNSPAYLPVANVIAVDPNRGFLKASINSAPDSTTSSR